MTREATSKPLKILEDGFRIVLLDSIFENTS
jgi:hypothetical protein